jgi:hypothetical protein
MSESKRERLVLAITFGLTNIALFLFAVLPLDTVIWAEVLVAAFAAMSATLVALNVSDRANQNSWVRAGYLFTGATALYALGAFWLTSDITTDWKVVLGIFLLGDIAGAYAAHIVMAGGEQDA